MPDTKDRARLADVAEGVVVADFADSEQRARLVVSLSIVSGGDREERVDRAVREPLRWVGDTVLAQIVVYEGEVIRSVELLGRPRRMRSHRRR